MKPCVYMIANDQDRTVKIGTTVNIRRRLGELQAGSATKLRVIRLIKGGRRTESWLHGKFHTARVGGEWYAFTEAMLSITPPSERVLSKPVLFDKSEMTDAELFRLLKFAKSINLYGINDYALKRTAA